DLVAGARNGNQVWTLLGNGAGGFEAASSTVGMSPSELVLTDFNADGVDDIWVCDREPASAGQVQRTELHLGLPEGGFDAAAELSFEIPVDANFQVWCGGLLAEDVDDDGLPDLILGTSVQATNGGPVELDMNIYINESDG
ncbi:MAG: VCBS repeat-containing protein, partial [Deltaproteobacteria bacterium]|nr:VCBS repeat-containing protein [Deltaproteobacteria bacterium]